MDGLLSNEEIKALIDLFDDVESDDFDHPSSRHYQLDLFVDERSNPASTKHKGGIKER